MELWFVMVICSKDSFSGIPCNTIAGAYWEEIHGPQVLENAQHVYIDPILKKTPLVVKSAGMLGYSVYTKRAHIGLYHGLSYDVRDVEVSNGMHATVSYLSYNWSF